MGEFFQWLFGKAPDIIREAARSPLGLAALSVLVLGIVGVLLFREAAGQPKLVAFAMITGGLLGFLMLVVVFASSPTTPDTKEEADRNTCAHYAASAVADYKRMMEIPKCQDYTTTLFLLDGNQLIKVTSLGVSQFHHRGRTGRVKCAMLTSNNVGRGRNDQARAAYGEAIALNKEGR
jgi:hypothetical protein